MSKKKLLVLAASLYQLDAIRTAKRLGYEVVTTDNVPSNPGHAIADKCYNVDTTDMEGVLEVARAERIDGVISPCTDVAVPTAAYVAENLGIPGPRLNAARILCNKVEFRTFLAEQGFQTPSHYRISGGFTTPSGIFATGKWIAKPDRSSGSKGIFIVSSESEFQARLPETLSFSPTGTGVLEQFLEGRQGTCEAILKNGELTFACVMDRQTAKPPHVVTCGHHVPSTLSNTSKERLFSVLTRICRMLAVTDGPLDCDFVATSDEVYILEMTPRLGGNSISTLLRKALDFDIVEYSVKTACGDSAGVPVRVSPRPTALVLLGVPDAGRLTYNETEAQQLRDEDWVDHLMIDLPLGAQVEPFINGRHRVGEALVFGTDEADVAARVLALRSRLSLGVG